jgi:hypothetical protein
MILAVAADFRKIVRPSGKWRDKPAAALAWWLGYFDANWIQCVVRQAF